MGEEQVVQGYFCRETTACSLGAANDFHAFGGADALHMHAAAGILCQAHDDFQTNFLGAGGGAVQTELVGSGAGLDAGAGGDAGHIASQRHAHIKLSHVLHGAVQHEQVTGAFASIAQNVDAACCQ